MNFKSTMNGKQTDFDGEILTSFDFPADEIGDINFINRSGSVNWNAVVTVDIEKMLKEKNFISLKENVLNIVNYQLESTPSAVILDPGFIKLFRMAQLTIEYLLHIQKYLRSIVSRSDNDKKSMQEVENRRKNVNGLTTTLDEYNSATNNYNVRKGHRLIILENEFENIFQCRICGKVFLDEHYLAAHHQRRHSGLQQLTLPEALKLKSNVASNSPESLPSKLQQETEKIWKELEMLRKKVTECESCNLKNKDLENVHKSLDDHGRNEGSLVRSQEALKLLEEECDCNNLKTTEEEKMKENDLSKVKEDGRLEAQERVWRGRLKALMDERLKEIESLKKMISSFQQKEDRYERRIENLTAELREKSMRQLEKQVAQDMEEEAVASVSIPENVADHSNSSEASEDASQSSQSEAQGPSKLNSTFTYGADEEDKSTDSEVESSEDSYSIAQRSPDEDLGEEEENQVMNSKELTEEIFNRKLKHLGINPKAKKMTQDVFKEKMDVLKQQQKDLAKNIEGYHQIKSNIEEKALAKVSQRLQGPHVKHSRSLAKLPSQTLEKFRPKHVKRRNFDTFEFSPKDTSTPSTSRSSSSYHASASKQKDSLKNSPVIFNTSSTSRSGKSVLGTKNSKGMIRVASHIHPKEQGRPLSLGSQGIQISCKEIQENQRSSSGGILRGVTIEATDRNTSKRVSAQPQGNVASKSVSFSLAHNLV